MQRAINMAGVKLRVLLPGPRHRQPIALSLAGASTSGAPGGVDGNLHRFGNTGEPCAVAGAWRFALRSDTPTRIFERSGSGATETETAHLGPVRPDRGGAPAARKAPGTGRGKERPQQNRAVKSW